MFWLFLVQRVWKTSQLRARKNLVIDYYKIHGTVLHDDVSVSFSPQSDSTFERLSRYSCTSFCILEHGTTVFMLSRSIAIRDSLCLLVYKKFFTQPVDYIILAPSNIFQIKDTITFCLHQNESTKIFFSHFGLLVMTRRICPCCLG